MSRLNHVTDALATLQAQHLQRKRRTVDHLDGVHATVDGKAVLAFCSNDYLGLAGDPRLTDALCDGARLHGAGAGASHLISGHLRAHATLENRLGQLMTDHIPSADALYFCTGYMANLALISGLALLDDNTEIFSEALNHASLIDGMRLARVPTQVYPHGDLTTLQAQLTASTATNKLVVTDSVFSMDGNLADLPALLALCQAHDAWLVIDDAHGFGVLGHYGKGVLEHFGLQDERLVYMGTLGKAAGLGGAFISAHADVISWLVQRARPYIYTTAAPPALAHALLTSLDIITSADGQQRRRRLADHIAHLRQGLTQKNWRLLPSATAIQPLLIGDNAQALTVSAHLYEQGLWVPAIRPPTVPKGTARLRIALSAAHTPAHIDQLIVALNTLEAQTHPA